MSVEDQQITVVGTLGGNPELKFTPSGRAVCNFSLAVNHRRYDKQSNAWVESGTDWHRITVWGQMAENVTESFNRGDRVLVVGRLASRQYENRDGAKITTWEITADECGPSVKWATTSQHKAERQQGGGGQQGGQYQRGNQQGGQQDDPWGQGYQQQANYGGQQGGQQRQAPAQQDDPWGQPPLDGGGFDGPPPF